MVEEVGGRCGRLQRGRGRKCNECCCWCRWWFLSSPSARGDGAGRRPRCYHGFHVLRDSGVPRVSTNGTTVDREQLRQNDQHVLEHHKFHISNRQHRSYNRRKQEQCSVRV